MTNTPDKRPDVEGIEARAENLRVCEHCNCVLADLVAIAKPSDTKILIAWIEALEARQVKLEAEIRRRWVNSLVQQGAAPESATRNVAGRPVLDSDGGGDG